MTPLRSIDWKETAALIAVLAVLFAPLRWLWRVTLRRMVVRAFADALREVLKDDLAPIGVAVKQTETCAEALNEVVSRLELFDEDITILFDHALGIDRRGWEERRENPRPNAPPDRRRRRLHRRPPTNSEESE